MCESERWPLQLAGGDDYELCFTAAPEQHAAIVAALAAIDTPAQVIGAITAAPGLHVIAADGSAYTTTRSGYQHFTEQGSERSEEHTSELQSIMRRSYAVFCWKKKKIL